MILHSVWIYIKLKIIHQQCLIANPKVRCHVISEIALDFPVMFDVDIAFNTNIASNIEIAKYIDIAICIDIAINFAISHIANFSNIAKP